MTQSSSSSTYQPVDRTEIQQLVQAQLKMLLTQGNYEGAKILLHPVQSADVAEVIAELPEAMQAIAFRLLPKDRAISVYEYLNTDVQEGLLAEFQQQEFIDIVNHMSPDDRARLFDELPARVVSRMLDRLSPSEREATALLLGYKPNTAGRIMTPEIMAMTEDLTVAEAFARIRRQANLVETIYELYVTDRAGQLTGVFSLRSLVTSALDKKIGDIMTTDVISVHTDTDQEEVAKIIQRYDFLTLPVVDNDNQLVGVITVDDILDVVEAETTEDIYTLGAVESKGDDYFQSNLFQRARKRVIWLLVLLITNTGTTAIMQGGRETLEQVVALTFFVPLLIGTGGNVGAQSSTVVIRGLNTEDLSMKKALGTIQREGIAGTLLGLMLGVIVLFWAFFLQRDWGVAITVGISLVGISILAAVAGSALPFLCKQLNRDPALMSAPFITTMVDMLGVLLYLNVARWVMGL
ncbi:magnesium transporter [Leptolyngbya sp. AN02str]|uniref:magnesium transporter n=1 Tax=Leptolyngbya sp. AN02str TaxID=3423363 RepID=UPI003D317ACF